MPQGTWKSKDERQYEHVKESEARLGKPAKIAKRIAAATVNKTRKKQGRTKGSSTLTAGAARRAGGRRQGHR